MNAQVKAHPDTVTRCVPRQDGGYLVVTRKGASGYSPEEVHEGAHVLVRNGQIVRPQQ